MSHQRSTRVEPTNRFPSILKADADVNDAAADDDVNDDDDDNSYIHDEKIKDCIDYDKINNNCINNNVFTSCDSSGSNKSNSK